MNTFEKVCEILKDIFDDENMVITEKDNSYTIEKWDSVAQISIITTIENIFNIEFSFKEINDIKNIGELVKLIDKKRGV